MQSPHLPDGSCDELCLKVTQECMLLSCNFLIRLDAGANNRAERYNWNGSTYSTSLKVSQSLCRSSDRFFSSSEICNPISWYWRINS